ncbi:MAG: MSCRAMM family protein [Candidatus Thorarchaeota archaeon]
MRKPLGSILLIIGVLTLSPFLVVDDLSVVTQPQIEPNQIHYSPTYQTAASPTRSGVLDAIGYIQSGINVETTGLLSARTDETPSVESNITLDTANDWRSNQIELNVSEIRKLLVLNGTFTDGYPGVNVNPSGSVSYYPLGWDADGFNKEPAKQTLRAVYNDTVTEFIELELEGEATGQPQDFKVHKDSWVYWYQDVTRSPSETDFLLSFDLLYDSGPIGPRRTDDFELRIEADSTVLWSLDPVTISGRDLWYHIGPIPVSLASAPTSFEFRFVFEIVESRTLEGDRADYDGDWDNARFLRFFVDDMSLISADYIDPDDANMRVDVAPVGMTSISGSNGNGQALVNHSYWDTSPLQLSILSDEPVSFDYEARFVSEFRTGNTSWSTNPTETGVGFSVDSGGSPVLTSYFYLPAHHDLEDFTVELSHPPDYENPTIYDASSADVTSSCTLSETMIVISGDILDSLGWWRVVWETPNYARKITPQQYVMPSWDNQTQFNADDQIRSLVEIGTATPYPALIENLTISWFLPNGTLWFEETINDGVDGVAYSTGLTLEANNATPGQWSILVFWNNGTEIAYGEVSFDLYHSSSLLPVNSFIEAEPDSSATCAVYLRDADTNGFLLDGTSTVVGNWSGETIVFQRNLAQSWWEGELNTSMMGFGNYTVVINATTPYYSFSTCSVTAEIATAAEFVYFGESYVDVGLGSSYDAKFRYSYSDDTGIEDALIEVISIVGPPSGVSYGGTVATPGEPGNYSIDFQVDLGGTYLVVISASKAGHNTETVSFNIISTAIGTDMTLLNGTSDVMNVGESYRLAVQYLNDTGEALDGASVSVVNVLPSSGLTLGTFQSQGNGTYAIIVDADLSGIYSITIRGSLDGYDSQIRIFSLVVSSSPSILSVNPSVASISADSDYTMIVTFTDASFQGLENASVVVVSVDPASGLFVSGTTELGSGLYSITLDPSVKGTYNLVLRGALENYQNGTALFTLVVTDVPTTIRTSDGLVSGDCFFTGFLEITLLYERFDNGTFIPGALIEISDVDGFDYVMVETPQGYVITLNPTEVGRWSLSLKAFRAQYQNASMIFDFEVRRTVTSLIGDGPEEVLYFGGSYEFILSYYHNGSIGINNATIRQTRGSQGNPLLWTDNNDGTYSFTISAGETGLHVLSIELVKYGFATAESTFEFNVSLHVFEIPSSYALNSTYSLLQGDSLDLTLRLTTKDNGEEVFNAIVSYLILETGTSGVFVNQTDGSYTATIPVPLAPGTYTLGISLQNHQFEDMDIDIVLISEVDSTALALGYLITGIEVSALFMGIVSVVYIGRRRQKQTAARKRVELLGFRERFNDANNILGLLVVQRSNGLPVFSRIIKGGFEMSMISGFITAVSGFASEIGTEEKLWTGIPISDILTAVRTKELICTLLTVDAPSPTLIKNLEGSSVLIGSKFDSDPDLLTTMSRYTKSANEYENEFDSFFETQFDYKLLNNYSSYDLSRKGEFPLIELAIISGDLNRPFYVSDLVRYLVTSGIEETRAYSLVIDAVESDFLLSLDES